MKKLLLLILLPVVLGLTGCEQKGPAEKVGEKIDNATQKMKDKATAAEKNMQNKVESAKDKMQDATDKAKQKMDDAMSPQGSNNGGNNN